MNAGVGAAYHTRDPIACPSAAEQPKGVPNVQQATRIFRCSTEGDLKSPVSHRSRRPADRSGAPRSIMATATRRSTPARRFTPFAAHGRSISASVLKEYPAASAKNCSVFDESNASGSLLSDDVRRLALSHARAELGYAPGLCAGSAIASLNEAHHADRAMIADQCPRCRIDAGMRRREMTGNERSPE